MTQSPDDPTSGGILSSVTRVPERTHFVGALLGGAMGDALGRPAEGHHPESIKSEYGRLTDYQTWRGWEDGPIGTVTDDTQLTICVAECLTANGWLNPDDLARRFIAWLPVGRGKGHSTTAAVRRLMDGVPWYVAGDLASGNAPAMRAAPIGLLRWNNPALLRAEAILSALPTHRQSMGVAGAVVMAAAMAWLLQRQPGTWATAEFIAAARESIVGLETEALPERRNSTVFTTLYDRIGEIPGLLEEYRDNPEAVFDRLYNGAYVLESLPSALFCFLRSPNNVEESLLLAVNAGHDADTVAAMAGTLGGALGGMEALPARLLGELEYREELMALGSRLFGLATYGDSTRWSENMQSEFGLVVANSELTESNVPAVDADWSDVIPFALTFDGYQHWGSFDRCTEIADHFAGAFGRTGQIPDSLTDLRTCLFFEQRRWRHSSEDPLTEHEQAYIRALLAGIHEKALSRRMK